MEKTSMHTVPGVCLKRQPGWGESGAVLVFVLWALALLSFLGLQTAVASRLRASEALSAWEQLQRGEALRSVMRYVAVTGKNHHIMRPGLWYRWIVGGQEVWVLYEKESSKIRPTDANDAEMRRAFVEFLPLADVREADELTDALLDWQDADDMVRLQGAEAPWYLQRGLKPPTNRPFSSLCEIQKVRGVGPELFWGDFLEKAERAWEQRDVQGQREMLEPERRSLVELLTVTGSKADRLTVLLPLNATTYEVAVIVGKADRDGWSVADRCQGFVRSTPVFP
ncbi:type II secretion system protein GspK [Desulfosoma caldarium]|uniref:Type II secretory pathway component PulK n=1 Tax=Desulfosoma caldarium TaxID=610254 RepID=A0A3N1VJY9_9BACT|nr:type II secretion system protein GspK [Desulfosoma caldarium]ROR03136.1 type II secretory pathway component PulK [Desulfosoma caldarium]